MPPDQAEAMFDAVRTKGIPTAYLAFAGEQHGFRQAGREALYFFCRLFWRSTGAAREGYTNAGG